jgi:hypothetical protein
VFFVVFVVMVAGCWATLVMAGARGVAQRERLRLTTNTPARDAEALEFVDQGLQANSEQLVLEVARFSSG